MKAPATGAPWIDRVQSLLGVAPLGLYLVFHVWQSWGAFHGRGAWTARMDVLAHRQLEVVLLLIPLLAHGVLGIRRMSMRPQPSANPLGGVPMQRVQAVTGMLVLLFLGFHLRQVWLWQSGPHVDPAHSYDILWRSMGHPLDVLIYSVGVTAVCLHFGHGLSRMPFTWGLSPSLSRVAVSRLLASLVALGLWLASLNAMGHFVTGQALFSL